MMTLEELDAALLLLPRSPVTQEDIEARAMLTRRRHELAVAARDAAAASNRHQPVGNFVVSVPAGIGVTHFYGKGGRVVCSRMTEEGVVLDLFPDEFKTLLADGKHGLAWHNANPEALRRLCGVS
jgi:hypothetical protein